MMMIYSDLEPKSFYMPNAKDKWYYYKKSLNVWQLIDKNFILQKIGKYLSRSINQFLENIK